jgi:formyltetrahydrofolate deformylase
MPDSHILKVVCPDQSGLIAAVTRTIAESGGNVLHLSQYTAVDIGAFFMKTQFETAGGFDAASFESAFADLAERFRMEWSLFDRERRRRVAILVSKTSHCLYELLLKHQDGELACDIPVIVSNHPDLAAVATQFHVPFFKVDPEKGKAAYEADLESILADYEIDLVVLARYMQVLSGEFAARWNRKVINIHHGFLPAFQGAKPYHQAWAKGVKIIGATAHFVSEVLDEGPIIAQDVLRVADTRSVSEFIRLGKDIERKVLYEALRLYLDDSVFVREGRTFIIP